MIPFLLIAALIVVYVAIVPEHANRRANQARADLDRSGRRAR